jgi:hypothetical protein
MKVGKRAAIALGVTVLVAGALFTGFAAAGGLGKDRVVSDPAVGERGSGYYPYVHAQASVDSAGGWSRVKGFVSISHPGLGMYCLLLPRGVKPSSYVAVATSDYSLSPSTDVSAQWRSSSLDCPSTKWVNIRTFVGGLALSDQGFSVIVP